MPSNQLENSFEGELQAELQLILNAVVEGVCGVDAEGNATFCNDALLKMTGYQAEEFLGKNVHELLHHSRLDGTRYPAEECYARDRLLSSGGNSISSRDDSGHRWNPCSYIVVQVKIPGNEKPLHALLEAVFP